jgi:hypothetical protein
MGTILQSKSHRLGGLFYAGLILYPQVFDAFEGQEKPNGGVRHRSLLRLWT